MRASGQDARQPRSSDAGLTIVELLIALSIIMVVFAALASTVIAAFSGIRSNEARVRATALANEAIEDLATMPWATLGLSEEDDTLTAKLQEMQAAGEIEADSWALDGDDLEFATINNELVVLLADSAAVPTHQPPLPIDRDGRDFTLARWVTFVDEDGGADLKRITVVVSWDQAGAERSITAESLRAPDPDDVFDLEVTDVSAYRAGSDESRVALDGDLTNAEAFVVRATIERIEADVVMTFTDRDGVLRVITVPSVGGEAVREITIPDEPYRFPHGPVTMLVTATGQDGQVASNSTTMRFYQDVVVDEGSITLFQGATAADLEETEDILLAEDCTLFGVVRVEAAVAGLTLVESSVDEAILIDYGGTGPATMGHVSTTVAGGVFGVDLTGDQAADDHADQVRAAGSATFTITASRTVENASFDDLNNPGSVELDLVEPAGTSCP